MKKMFLKKKNREQCLREMTHEQAALSVELSYKNNLLIIKYEIFLHVDNKCQKFYKIIFFNTYIQIKNYLILAFNVIYD